MAAGNLIYVGKSRLRRKFRQRKIESRIKRQERRRAERLGRESQSARDGTRDKLSESSDSGHSTASSNEHLEGEDNHCCKYCEDCGSLDFDCGSSGSDSDELLPLIDNLSSRPLRKMPLFGKKKEAKSPKISKIPEDTPETGPPPYVQREEKPAEMAAPAPPPVPPPSAEDVSAKITLLLEVERRLKEKEDKLKELEEKYLQEKQKLAEEEARRAAAEEAETVLEGEVEPGDKEKGEKPGDDAEPEPASPKRSFLKRKRLPEYQPGGMLCCTIM